jgi:S1-C subfamily serine protease
MIRQCSLVGAMAFALAACCETTEIVLPRAAALDAVASEASAPAAAFIGLALEENVSGSIDDLAIADGLRVARVEKGSPAEAVGVKRGDLITKVDGVALVGLDQWQAVLDGTARGDVLRLEVDRSGALSEVDVTARTQGGAELPAPRRFVERVRGKLVVESVAEPDVTGARVVELLPSSPFRAAGFVVDDVIVAIDGVDIRAASELIRALEAAEPGATVVVRRDGAGAGADDVSVELLDRPRVLTGLGLPILFHFDRDLTADTTEFALVDLWLIALYDYRRQGEARRHRILRWIRWQTGEGNLSEEAP